MKTYVARHSVSRLRIALLVGTALTAIVSTVAPARAFVTFETGQVRPLALSPDGSRLFVCNTHDNELEVFDVTASGLDHVASIPVGLEPLAVAARTNTEVWVLNHLSDSVSIIDVSTLANARVVRTLLVGDEPRDIVFGGPSNSRAFITTSDQGELARQLSRESVAALNNPELLRTTSAAS